MLRRTGRIVLAALAGLGGLQVLVLTLLEAAKKLRGRDASAGAWLKPFPPVLVETNEVQLFPEGEAWHQAALEAINTAREYIWLETFLWHKDSRADEVKAALIARAREGLPVYVIYDWLGTAVMAASFPQFPSLPNLHVLRFRPRGRPAGVSFLRRAGRDHRKILVVDGRLGFVGGFNIGGLYGRWRDTQLRLAGPVVRDLAGAYARFWNRYRDPGSHPVLEAPEPAWVAAARVVVNERALLSFPIRGLYLQAIERARYAIRITQPYLMPDRAFLDALVRASRRGVDVRIIVPATSNHVLATWLSRRRFAPLLAGGVRIFAYRDGMLHAKTVTVDGVWSTVGTANFDRLSLLGNNEVNIELLSPALAAQLERLFEEDCTQARELTAAAWAKRPWYEQLVELILSPLWPLA